MLHVLHSAAGYERTFGDYVAALTRKAELDAIGDPASVESIVEEDDVEVFYMETEPEEAVY